MVVLLDTCFLLALINKSDVNHHNAKEKYVNIIKGVYGRVILTEYVFDELMTLALVRNFNSSETIEIGNKFLKSNRIKLLITDYELFFKTWNIFQKYIDQKLSFTDSNLLAIEKKFQEKGKRAFIASYDTNLIKNSTPIPG